ncbi:MAG: 4Fe-4S ferredoxin, partial [Firmicutes bacterium]|nr:4Fe-4S ferredoxin [Bacillota bacterium]
MSKFYELYFSPTGGTLTSVKKFGPKIFGILGMEPVPVNLLKLVRDGGDLPAFSAEDICLVSVPSFAGRVPLPAVNLLQQLAGNGARAVLHVVYGNRAIDDTLLELRDVMEAAGFVCAAAVETVAEHSIFRQFGAGRPDAADEAEMSDFACQIAEIL